MEHTIVMAIATLVGNVFGLVLKRFPDLPNKIIPVALLFLNAIKLVFVNAGLLPDNVTLAGTDTGTAAIMSLLGDTALMVGVHSGVKNIKQHKGAGKRR